MQCERRRFEKNECRRFERGYETLNKLRSEADAEGEDKVYSSIFIKVPFVFNKS